MTGCDFGLFFLADVKLYLMKNQTSSRKKMLIKLAIWDSFFVLFLAATALSYVFCFITRCTYISSAGPAKSHTLWSSVAVYGPTLTIEAWKKSNPLILIMSYQGWRGITSAAFAQGPILGTTASFTLEERKGLVSIIKDTHSLRAVIVHGVPPNSLEFAQDLHGIKPSLPIIFVFHGAASAPFHPAESNLVDDLINATLSGVVKAVGNVKVGFSTMFSTFGAPSVFTVPNFPSVFPILPASKLSTLDGYVHIGLFSYSNDTHKNVDIQFLAACMVPNAIIHVTFVPPLAFAGRCQALVVETGLLSHTNFLLVLSQMDIVMYISLTEAYPMVVIEAMSLGIPSLVSRTHHVYDSDTVLKDMLVLYEADDPELIALKLIAAVQNNGNLKTRLLARATCLRYEGEVTWGQILDFNSADSRRLQLDAFADSLITVSDTKIVASSNSCRTVSLLSSPLFPIISLNSDSLDVKLSNSFNMRFAFMTYELSPGNPGGAGVVISNLISMLLESGFKVTVLAHTPEGVLERWTQHMVSEGWEVGSKQQLTVHHVPTLVDEDTLVADKCHPRNIFLRRSRLFALAARKAYDLDPFDALEVFEYAGAAFELLRSAKEWEYGVPRGLKVPEPYLPSHVPILLRLHGSIQLIAQAEGGLDDSAESFAPRPCLDSDDEVAASPLMHLMERYALQTAHVLLPQSRSMQDVYEKAYGLTSERMLVAPPPMDKILGSLRKGLTSENLESKNALKIQPDLLNSTGGVRGSQNQGALSPFRLLVYGRVAKMKGAETVARAASILQDLLPSHLQLHLIFAGLDWPHPTEHRPTSEVVKSLIPAGFRGKIEYLGDTPRSSLVNLTRSVHGGVLASEFETFGLAAHELAALGVPLVISNIPAYGEFFPPSVAYVFKAGNATDLASASLRLFNDIVKGSPMVFAPKYDSAVVPYMRVFKYLREQQGRGISFSNSDARLVKVAIDRLEAACWPSNSCAFNWGRRQL